MTVWHTGQAWRIVTSLNKLNEQLRAYAPRAVPPATDVKAWGSIADDAHSASSDHYPHHYPVLGSTAVVCARDFPHAPTLGLDGALVTEVLRRNHDQRIGYVIFNRRITGPNHEWSWQTYTGSDPHDTHFHISTVHTAIADDNTPWVLPFAVTSKEHEELDMTPEEHAMLANVNLSAIQANARIEALLKNLDASHTLTGTPGKYVDEPNALKVAFGSARPTFDAPALAAALAPLLNDALDTDALIGALESPRGQAALTAAANAAEDS